MTEAGAERLKVIVLDDDPTGSQTVHSCPLLLRWDPGTLRRGLAHPSPLLFVLANTRALGPAEARERVVEICRALKPLLAEAQTAGVIDRWLVVSRGDSTLRSHFPLEVEAIEQELGPFDATLLAPAFLPGGRTTVDGVHLLHGEPVHTTPFARDRLFGFSTSHLAAWVEEKTGGHILAGEVEHLSLADLEGGIEALMQRLQSLPRGAMVTVDAERHQHFNALGVAVRALLNPGGAAGVDRPRRFLFQSAASLLNGLVELPSPPLDAVGLAALRRRFGSGESMPGMVLVGSHVPLADAQLAELLADPACFGVEISVPKVVRLLKDPAPAAVWASFELSYLEQLRVALTAGRTPVLFTSRGEVHCDSAVDRRCLGVGLAGLMARLVARLAPDLGYVISKGGITSHTLLADGLRLSAVELQGQLQPGVSLVLASTSQEFSRLPVITFPGNLGLAEDLHVVYSMMQNA
ncbi:four-carbon acid sugar kinase family protein [Synechococcus sp. FGCU-3]|nr:four-carbon acid sugar kinase family protein [Synechococcus sp. FGCU3]